jgi:hypothetical protein
MATAAVSGVAQQAVGNALKGTPVPSGLGGLLGGGKKKPPE